MPDGDLTPKPRVLVLGGTGFIGRHAVAALLARDCRVVIGSRHPQRIARRVPGLADRCEHRHARLECLIEPRDWAHLLAGIDVVLNCVGILRQRGRETYQRVHHLAPSALAAACATSGTRLIHVSALGLYAGARSRFLRSKLDGENALRASGSDWCVVRPSLLDGDGGFGARWLRRVALWPVHPLPAGASGRIAAMHVADLGEALAKLAVMPAAAATECERIIELGGLERYTLADYVAAIRRRSTDRPALRLTLPDALARLGSHVCDLLHLTPFSYGHWELLQRDNCPADNRLPALLDRAPRALGCSQEPTRTHPVVAR